MKSLITIPLGFYVALTLFAVESSVIAGAPTQQFLISYDAKLTVDPRRASNTGLSQGMINTLTSVVGNSVSIGDVNDTVSFSKDTYHIHSVGTLSSMVAVFMTKGTFIRTSEGQIFGNKLNTLRYVDIRDNNPPLTTLVDQKNKRVVFYNGNTTVSSISSQNKIQDVLSVGYSFIGHLPDQTVSVSMSDGKSIKEAVFDLRKEMLQLSTGQLETIKLTRRLATRDEASVEYWLRPSDGLPLRVRIGMSQRYGAVLDLMTKKIPAKVQPF